MMVQFLGGRSDGCHKGERMREVRERILPVELTLADGPAGQGRQSRGDSSEDSFAG